MVYWDRYSAHSLSMISSLKRPFFLLAIFACSLGFLVGARAVSAATSTVCASGCDYTTLGGFSGALNNVTAGNVIAVEATYTSTTEPVFPLQFTNPEVTLDCQSHPTWIGSTSTDYGDINANLLYLASTTTIRNCSFGNIVIGTGSYVSGLSIVGNTFHPELTTSTISFNNGAALFTIENNTNIGSFGLNGSTTSSGGSIRSNTFYSKQRSSFQTGPLTLNHRVRDMVITGNTFSFYSPATVAFNPVITLVGEGIHFATNTIRYVEPQENDMTVGLTVKLGNMGLTYVGGNYISTPATSTCTGINIYPDESSSPFGTVHLIHNTIQLASTCGPSSYNGGSAGIQISDNMGTGAIIDVVAAYNIISNAGSVGGGGGVSLTGLTYTAGGIGSLINLTEDYNGFYRYTSNVKNGNTVMAIGTNSRTTNPMFRVANVSSEDDLQVVPFSGYLDVNGTRDIGAMSAVRRSTIAINAGAVAVDYSTVDATSTSDVNSFIRSNDSLTLAAGSYSGLTVSSTYATDNITITGAGNSTIINASGGDAIHLRNVTTSTLSSLRATGALVGATTYSVTKMFFSYLGNDYNDSAGAGMDPNGMLVWTAPACEINPAYADGFDITSLTAAGTVSFHVALADVGGSKVTVLVPADSIPNGAALEADCGGMVTVDRFISNIFVPTAGVYSYDASAVTGAGATLMGGLTAPAITEDSETYAGVRLVNASGWTISSVTSTGNATGIIFEGTTASSTIRDSVIENASVSDVESTTATINYLDNSSFDRTNVSVTHPLGSLLVSFRLRAYVTSVAGGGPVTGATVTSTGGVVVNAPLGSTTAGYTAYGRFPAYEIDSLSSAVTNGGYNPYILSATGTGFFTTSTPVFNLTQPDQTVSIALTPFVGPTAPNTLAIGSIAATTALASWVDAATDEDTYHYDYVNDSIGETFPSDHETSIAADATSVSLTGLLPNRQYRFRVWASNIGGESARVTSSAFYTLAAQSAAPTVSTLSRTTASLSISTDTNSTSTQYAVYNSTAGTYIDSAGIASVTPTWQTTSTWGTLTISGLSCGTSYSFVTIARNLLETPAATSTATGITTTACATTSGGGGGGGGGGAVGGGGGPILTFFPPVGTPAPITPPVSTPAPVPEPVVPSTPAPTPTPEPSPVVVPTAQSFVAQGTNPASRALGQGERQAILRDLQEVLGRSANAIPVEDLSRVANGQIPLTRNLAYERSMVPRALATFRTIYGRAPNFQNAEENLAWNTLMYRIRFTRNLTAERDGITQFRRTFRTTPQSPFQWSVVRVLGYVR